MKFIADFHIHSHYSLASARDLTPENLDYWAKIKGIRVLGSGDFTHPGWRGELKEKLDKAENGLFKLKKEYIIRGSDETRFILTAEISNIYKKNGKTRRIHNILLAPDFPTVDKISAALNNFGSLASNGRPILKLDSRDLLEIVLNASARAALIPAHIWTPWYSMLGNKSGFESLRECFGDLSSHIFAVETGLSSDPSMNRRCDFLDGLTLISNSDAHSPQKLGREANLFNCALNYDAIIDSINKGTSPEFLGTIEFFPQEGKYYFDGHRKCGLSLSPQQARAHNYTCPICSKPLTTGVLHRVEQLAKRPAAYKHKDQAPFYTLIALKDILSALYNVGSTSKKINSIYRKILSKGFSELDILLNLSQNDLKAVLEEEIAEAVIRVRRGDVKIVEGYDGQFGKIVIF